MAPSNDRLPQVSNEVSNYGSTAASESNKLIPNSNGNSSNNNSGSYQSVPTTETNGDGHKELSLYEEVEAQQKRRRIVIKLLQLLPIVLLGWAAYSFFTNRNDNRDGDDFSYKYVEQSHNTAYAPPLPVTGRRQPFSRLHPSQLGVPQFSRPTSSRPSAVLTHNDTTKPQPPFPTNAWYQNMLLATSEPTEINRAYATPFLVDAVGPIPGLRVLPNQVAASTSVIQLNNIVNYGLTVGAAPNAEFVFEKQANTKEEETSNEEETKETKTSKTDSETKTTSENNTKTKKKTPTYSNEYRVEQMTPLGLTLGWPQTYPMTSSIVKGMPYGTMVYESMTQTNTKDGKTWYPTVAAQIPLAQDPVVDGGKVKLSCLHDATHIVKETSISGPSTVSDGSSSGDTGNGKSSGTVDSNSSSTSTSSHDDSRRLQGDDEEKPHYQVTVEREVELHFAASDFTWLVFVSKPVTMQCVVDPETKAMQLQVVDTEGNTKHQDEPPFVIRVALSKPCTSNKNPIYCHHEQMRPYSLNLGQGRYSDLLRNHSHLVPGPNTNIDYDVDETKNQINIEFDWDTRDVRNFNKKAMVHKKNVLDKDLIVFALPHHLDLMGTRYAPGYLKYCASTLIGPACLLSGSRWEMVESMPQIGFRAPRPPAPWAIPSLAKSIKQDIRFKLPKFYQKGAGDTYFSGKMLAKLGRILAITEELKELCGQSSTGSVAGGYSEVCQGVTLPSNRDVRGAVNTLRSSVEVWLSGRAVTPFVFDDAWGGVVSCGCNNPDGGDCRNEFPECPAFTDPGLNFGNAFYNDLHFHYGYHIYAAAVVSHFDPDWGKKYFERVLLLIRNIANPADTGDYFPAFRLKDWYQGHSWASGVVPPYLNGRNQESSSESIAAYEAVALYGQVMASVFGDDVGNLMIAKEVKKAGEILTATELRSTRRYYHVKTQGNANQALKIYPSEYNNHAIGMMWNTMAQYQTWFGGKPYLAVGIQLLPITPIAEQRDGVEWLSEMYPSFAKTCAANKDCEENGWSVLQLASLATIGYMEEAAEGAEALSLAVFDSAGGNGHSLSNTLWYISTRVVVDEPMDMDTGNANDDDEAATESGNTTTSDDSTSHEDSSANGDKPAPHTKDLHVLTQCYRPDICTDYILDTIADEYSCRQRITYMMDNVGLTQEDACFTVAKIQFPEQCGACNPNATLSTKTHAPQCPPCTVDQCESSLNRCPQFRQTFVCTDGPNIGGCSRFPWDVHSEQCSSCCELTECVKNHHTV